MAESNWVQTLEGEIDSSHSGFLHAVLDEEEHPTVDAFLTPTPEPWSQYRSIYHKRNDYQLDWEAQRQVRFSGLPGIWPQDSACQESMGSIYDRSSEHLGTSDAGIIRARRSLISAATALRENGSIPASVKQPRAYRIRAASVVLPRADNWVESSREFREARPGVNFAAT